MCYMYIPLSFLYLQMTVEPPRGIKANLLKSFIGFTDEFLDANIKVNT